MAALRPKDPSLEPEASFERPPPVDLDETLPFSLGVEASPAALSGEEEVASSKDDEGKATDSELEPAPEKSLVKKASGAFPPMVKRRPQGRGRGFRARSFDRSLEDSVGKAMRIFGSVSAPSQPVAEGAPPEIKTEDPFEPPALELKQKDPFEEAAAEKAAPDIKTEDPFEPSALEIKQKDPFEDPGLDEGDDRSAAEETEKWVLRPTEVLPNEAEAVSPEPEPAVELPSAPELAEEASPEPPKPGFSVAYRRRRRKPAPVNPWTSAGILSQERSPQRDQEIQAALASLSHLLEESLAQTSPPPTEAPPADNLQETTPPAAAPESGPMAEPASSVAADAGSVPVSESPVPDVSPEAAAIAGGERMDQTADPFLSPSGVSKPDMPEPMPSAGQGSTAPDFQALPPAPVFESSVPPAMGDPGVSPPPMPVAAPEVATKPLPQAPAAEAQGHEGISGLAPMVPPPPSAPLEAVRVGNEGPAVPSPPLAKPEPPASERSLLGTLPPSPFEIAPMAIRPLEADPPAPPQEVSLETPSPEPVPLASPPEALGTGLPAVPSGEALPPETKESEAPAAEKPLPAVSPDPLERTAPTTLVSDDAPISPFTKLATATHPKPASTELGDAGDGGGEGEEASKFASPFASALERKRQAQATGTMEELERPSPMGQPRKRGPMPASLPPEPEGSPLAPANAGVPVGSKLPPARGLPSERKGGGLGLPMVAEGAAVSAPGVSMPAAEEQAQPMIRIRKRRSTDKETGRSRSAVWLSWVFGLIGGGFLVSYLFATYQSLTGPPLPLPESTPEASLASSVGAAASVEQAPLDLTDPMECVAQFLAADSPEGRLPFVLEREDAGLRQRMEMHYSAFPLTSGRPRQVADSGIDAGTGREYVSVEVAWRSGGLTKVRVIRDEEGDYRFSWTAFEQSRCQLLREYSETAWSEWTRFFIELKPLDPRRHLPEGIILENLYYRVTVPEDPAFEAIAYVDENSSMVPTFQERFGGERVYEVVVELQRDAKLLDDDRPVFRLTQLLASGWDFSGR